jgi:hypothetical protein
MVDPGSVAFVSGPVSRREQDVVAQAGDVRILVRSPEPRSALPVLVGGSGLYRVAGLAFPARPSGAWVQLSLTPLATVRDRAGRTESMARGGLSVQGEIVLRFGEKMGNSTP